MKIYNPRLLKYIWIVSIFLFSAVFIIKKYNLIVVSFRLLGFYQICISVAFIIISKILFVLVMRFSQNVAGFDLGFWQTFKIYNYSQLGKYIPGFIWQFAGKIGYYRSKNVTSKKIAVAMISEVMLDLSGALLIGLVLFVFPVSTTVLQYFDGNYLYWLVIAAVVVILLVAMFLKRKVLIEVVTEILIMKAKLILVFLFILILWSSLGFSYYIVVYPFAADKIPVFYVISLFCLSFFFGFIFPLAPAGLGVREAILVLGLSPYMPVDTAIILSGLNRLCYIFIELFMVLFYKIIERSRLRPEFVK